ncbi:MAG: chromosomal replication initiator protein DnaA [Planctomycetales bacterium]|nr:chromosomal replication initiator protein DnaA [Planctomycetales bacterium]
MEIERAIRRALTEQIGQDRYDVWFGDRIEMQVAGRRLTVISRNQFGLDRLRKDFAQDLSAVARRMLGPAGAVEYAVSATPPQPLESVGGVRDADPSDGAPVATKRPASRRNATKVAAHGAVQGARMEAGTGLPHAHRLDNFVVSDGTQVALTSAQIVLDRPGQCSPLFVYGPSGCGKTHLLDGIRRAAMTRMRRIVMLSAEQFTSEFLGALHGSGLPNFRRRYRDVELLMLDDVQFFANKRATLVELQHTLDSLLRQHRQVVLSADRSPAELNGLGPELVTRMAGGLVCGMEHPGQEARVRILQSICGTAGLSAPLDVIEFVAGQLSGDARQLRGAAHRLLAYSEATGEQVTVTMAERVLSDVIRATCRAVRLKDIESAVCDVFGLQPEDLHSERRSRAVSQPRMLAMWLARKHTRAAFSEIGDYFGGRSHSTVISASKKVSGWVQDGSAIQVAHGECPIDDAIRRVETRLRA